MDFGERTTGNEFAGIDGDDLFWIGLGLYGLSFVTFLGGIIVSLVGLIANSTEKNKSKSKERGNVK